MSSLRRRFHDPHYDRQVEEAHDFVGGELGLRVGKVTCATVVPIEREAELRKYLGDDDPDVGGEYFAHNGELYALTEPDTPGLPGSGLLEVRRRLVHEFTHKGTVGRGALEHNVQKFYAEALAGLGETAFKANLVANGELDASRMAQVYVAGRWLWLPGEYQVRDAEDFGADPSLVAAWALSLAGEVSGTQTEDLWEQARRWDGLPFWKAKLSVRAMDADAAEFVAQQPYDTEGVMTSARRLYEVAVQQGIVPALPPLAVE